ncbi:MAG: serine protease [Opitutae bacterium]|nr:serine protease [Opitutae bacterium]
MTTIITLFLAGVLLLALEVFVPGIVLGILGGLAIVAGVVMAFSLYGMDGGLIALLGGGVLLGATFYVEFVVLPKTRFARKLSMHATVDGTSQPVVADLNAILNQAGETATALAPSGYVTVQGRQYEAFSQSGYLAKGVPVRVTGLDNFRLIVTKNQTSS